MSEHMVAALAPGAYMALALAREMDCTVAALAPGVYMASALAREMDCTIAASGLEVCMVSVLAQEKDYTVAEQAEYIDAAWAQEECMGATLVPVAYMVPAPARNKVVARVGCMLLARATYMEQGLEVNMVGAREGSMPAVLELVQVSKR